MTGFYDIFETPLGWIGLLASERGLRRTTLPQISPDRCLGLLGDEAGSAVHDPNRFRTLRRKLLLYCQGQDPKFDSEPVDIEDAPVFFKAAWRACRRIPFGETRSYQWLAMEAGSPGACRAAGQAMAVNRIPLVIPCHRVISAGGGIGGYGAGANAVELKRRLLKLEGYKCPGI